MNPDYQNEFWLIFREGKHILNRFLKEGFGHISVLKRDQYNWLLLDPSSTRLDVTILPWRSNEDVPNLLLADAQEEIKIVYVKTRPAKGSRFKLPFTISCVGMIQYITGIKGFFVTPHDLYKTLINVEENKLLHANIIFCSERQ